MTAREFLKWLDNARPGAQCVYHVGNLQYDRGNEARADFRAIGHVADAAYGAYEKKKVALLQRRVNDEVCQYVAVRR